MTPIHFRLSTYSASKPGESISVSSQYGSEVRLTTGPEADAGISGASTGLEADTGSVGASDIDAGIVGGAADIDTGIVGAMTSAIAR